ncbi:MAG: hypothetical protein M3O65_10130 [Actinomycetota bacterium]|nr:hypothetical protein [Actinomycetota bacterium]
MTSNALAIARPSAVADGNRAASFFRYLDLLALAIALFVFVVAGLPKLGFAVLAAVWLMQLGVEAYAQRRSLRELAAGNRRGAMGWVGATTLGRVWLVVTAVLLVGLLGDREDGLAAALLSVVLFTLHFVGRFIARAIEGPPEGSPEKASGASA